MEILTLQSKLDQYLIKQMIQTGSSSSVYSVESNKTDLIPQTYFAAKIVDSSNYMAKEMLSKEYQILKELNHENIIKVYDAVENGNLELKFQDKFRDQNQKVDYMIMEQCYKQSLFDLIIDTGKCSINLGCFIFKQLINAVKYCHEQNVFHRDIKPENILFSYEGLRVKLIDFNLSEYGIYLPKRSFKGTQCYMAPEILQRQQHYGTYVDIFNCGVLLFILLTGQRPFLCASKNDAYYNYFYKNNPQEFWNLHQYRNSFNIPQILKDLIWQMLSENQDKRPTIEQIEETLTQINVDDLQAKKELQIRLVNKEIERNEQQ